MQNLTPLALSSAEKSVTVQTHKQKNQYVSEDRPLSTHADPKSTRRAILHERREVTNWNIHRPSRAGRFVRFWASWRAKFLRMGDSLPWTPVNRPWKFYAASFILGEEIRNHTNKKHTQTLADISTPCLYRHVWITNIQTPVKMKPALIRISQNKFCNRKYFKTNSPSSGRPYIHTFWFYVHRQHEFHERRISSAAFGQRAHSASLYYK